MSTLSFWSTQNKSRPFEIVHSPSLMTSKMCVFWENYNLEPVAKLDRRSVSFGGLCGYLRELRVGRAPRPVYLYKSLRCGGEAAGC